jgi:lipopolysaccharide export system protein LptA
VRLYFRDGNQLSKVKALEDVHFLQRQKPTSPDSSDMELIADQVDLFTSPAGALSKAITRGAARIEVLPAQNTAQQPSPGGDGSQPGGKTIITAKVFQASFDANSRIKTLHGEPDAKIVSTAGGRPDRVSTSRTLNITFTPGSTKSGIESALQQGGVHMMEGDREAFAQTARYTPADDVLVLSGSPRVDDPGMLTTARIIRMNRASGDAIAEDDVKTTYTELKEQPQGALLASGDPIHVTARTMIARRATGTAHYSGSARLWQAANIVQAHDIEFKRENRSMQATGTSARPVTTVLVQRDKTGRVTPVNITSSRLTYSDTERVARFEGGVLMKTAEGTLTSERLDAFLLPRTEQANVKLPSGASQLHHAVAQGRVELHQPGRQAQGERLVYTAAESKYVLTGTKLKQPTLADVTHGTVIGDSLTFYSRDDRVVIGSATSAPTVTQTRVPKQQ